MEAAQATGHAMPACSRIKNACAARWRLTAYRSSIRRRSGQRMSQPARRLWHVDRRCGVQICFMPTSSHQLKIWRPDLQPRAVSYSGKEHVAPAANATHCCHPSIACQFRQVARQASAPAFLPVRSTSDLLPDTHKRSDALATGRIAAISQSTSANVLTPESECEVCP